MYIFSTTAFERLFFNRVNDRVNASLTHMWYSVWCTRYIMDPCASYSVLGR